MLDNTKYAGPTWDNSTEYPALDSPEFRKDHDEVEKGIASLGELTSKVNLDEAQSEADWMAQVPGLQKACVIRQRAFILLWNIRTYVNCILSVNGRDQAAKVTMGRIESLWSKFNQANNPADLFITLAPQAVIEKYLDHPATSVERFPVSRRRLLRDQKLSLREENLLSAMEIDGIKAWGNLYDSISTALMCEVEMPEGKKTVGVATAFNMLQSDDEAVRKAAHEAFERAWETQDEPCAAALNAIAGWRLEEYRQRSRKKPVHFLDGPLYSSRIERATLDAMMDAVARHRETGRKAMRLMARAYGKKTLSASDLFAPPPAFEGATERHLTFHEGIELVASAYGDVHPEMGEFVRMMREKKWIDGSIGPAKAPGAYCTKFAKSRTPRVYMTYDGGGRNLRTLAHELGHAYHNWIMRDMPLPQTSYPMTLAETASIFGETAVNDVILRRASNDAERLQSQWDALVNAVSFLLNIPARYTFEKELYERRAAGQLTATQLKELMVEHWQEHYGDTLADYPKMFWASKLHFYITSVSFYNFPYTFGYLFALGVYALRDKLGGKFHEAYVSLLRDTGLMTAEDVARKHLGADLTRPEFWNGALSIASSQVDRFEETLTKLGR